MVAISSSSKPCHPPSYHLWPITGNRSIPYYVFFPDFHTPSVVVHRGRPLSGPTRCHLICTHHRVERDMSFQDHLQWSSDELAKRHSFTFSLAETSSSTRTSAKEDHNLAASHCTSVTSTARSCTQPNCVRFVATRACRLCCMVFTLTVQRCVRCLPNRSQAQWSTRAQSPARPPTTRARVGPPPTAVRRQSAPFVAGHVWLQGRPGYGGVRKLKPRSRTYTTQ